MLVQIKKQQVASSYYTYLLIIIIINLINLVLIIPSNYSILVMVRTKSSSTKGANNGFPRFHIKWDIAKPCGCLHVRHTCTTAAPRTRPRCWLALLHLLSLIHQKTKEHHFSSSSSFPSHNVV